MLKLHEAEKIATYLDSEGYECTVTEDYSGRGMYGKSAIAITTNAAPITFGFCASQAGIPLPTIRNLRRDNLGDDHIYY